MFLQPNLAIVSDIFSSQKQVSFRDFACYGQDNWNNRTCLRNVFILLYYSDIIHFISSGPTWIIFWRRWYPVVGVGLVVGRGLLLVQLTQLQETLLILPETLLQLIRLSRYLQNKRDLKNGIMLNALHWSPRLNQWKSFSLNFTYQISTEINELM